MSKRKEVTECLIGLAIATFLCASLAAAQTLGTVTNVSAPLASCGGRNFNTSMTCRTATLSGCPGADDLDFIYGVANSGGVKGTIVLFGPMGGNNAGEGQYVAPYISANYQVVQVAWGPGSMAGSGIDWEYTSVTVPPDNTLNIRTAACRPASFLNWVRFHGPYAGGGMCAQGHSGGSAAIAYALAWYNAGSGTVADGQGYLDKAILKSGPVFGDIQQGCTINSSHVNNQYTFICVGTGQAGCNTWIPLDPPGYHLEYIGGSQNQVNDWSGNPSPACGNNHVQTTFDTQWKQMSIVDFTSVQQPSFNYPNTKISGWLCETTADGVPANEAAPQGEIFFKQFTALSQAGGSLSVNSVTNCLNNSEDVDNGSTVIGTTTHNPASGAIILDMTTGSPACARR
jgi:hypothetical protein